MTLTLTPRIVCVLLKIDPHLLYRQPFPTPYAFSTPHLSTPSFSLLTVPPTPFPIPSSSTTEANNSSNSNGSSKEPAQTTVADITDRSHFAAIIASKDLTVVDYWAPWCKYVRTQSYTYISSQSHTPMHVQQRGISVYTINHAYIHIHVRVCVRLCIYMHTYTATTLSIGRISSLSLLILRLISYLPFITLSMFHNFTIGIARKSLQRSPNSLESILTLNS